MRQVRPTTRISAVFATLSCAFVISTTSSNLRADDPAKQEAPPEKAKPMVAENAAKPAADAAAPIDAGEMVQRISRALLSKADIQVKNVPLSKFVDGLAKQYKIPFKIDEPALKKNSIKLDTPVTASFTSGTLNQALKAILTDHKLRWVLRDTEVLITAIPEAEVRAVRELRVQRAPAQAEQQFVPQFRALFKAEMYFLGKVCQPTKEQMDAIQATSAATTLAASKRYAEHSSGMRAGIGSTSVSPDPRSLLQESLLPVLKTNLKPEQLARYSDEMTQRQSAKQAMAVDNLVAKLDRDLSLTIEQREKLAKAMSVKWDHSWCQSSQALLNLDQFFPAIPDDLISPHLNERQKEIWRGMRKNQGQVFFGGGFGLFGNEVDETAWDKDEGAGE